MLRRSVTHHWCHHMGYDNTSNASWLVAMALFLSEWRLDHMTDNLCRYARAAMSRASFSTCSKRSSVPRKRYCASSFKQLTVAWPSMKPLEVSDTTPRCVCKTLHFFGFHWSPIFSIICFRYLQHPVQLSFRHREHLKIIDVQEIGDRIGFESLYPSVVFNFHLRTQHIPLWEACWNMDDDSLFPFTVCAAIFVFQLSHSLPTTSQIHFGNLWSHMIFFNQWWSTQSYALHTSIHATPKLHLFQWQSKVTIRSIMKLLVVPLHFAFTPLWLFSISSHLSTCSSIGPKTHYR